MSDVNETLQELMHRRLREMGRSRGSAESLPLRQAHQTLPLGSDGKPVVSYETFRQIHTGSHSGNISDVTAEALALALKVDADDIYVAVGQRPRLGDFELPARAAQLDDRERRVVLGVIDAILDASGRGAVVEEPTNVPADDLAGRRQAQEPEPMQLRAARKNTRRPPRGPKVQEAD